MRVPINLASQPYENLRPLYSAAVLALALLMALALTLALKERRNRNQTRLLTEQSEQLDKGLADLRREQRELTQWLGRPDVQEIRDRSAFLNSLIIRKSLSWTQMFMDLEKVLPNQVLVTAIRPGKSESAQAQLKITVAAGTVPPLVEFLKNLEAAPQFAKPVVDLQHFPTDKSLDPHIILELSVVYHQAGRETLPSTPEANEPEDERQSRDGTSRRAVDSEGASKSVEAANAQKGAR